MKLRNLILQIGNLGIGRPLLVIVFLARLDPLLSGRLPLPQRRRAGERGVTLRQAVKLRVLPPLGPVHLQYRASQP